MTREMLEKIQAIVAEYEQHEDLTDVLSRLSRLQFWPRVGVRPVHGGIEVYDENINVHGDTVKVAMLRYLNKIE